MPSHWRGSFLAILFLLANYTFAGETGTLLGRALKENDVPIAGLPIYYSGPAFGHVVSDDDGSFRIDAAPGAYTLQIFGTDTAPRGLFDFSWMQFSLNADQTVSNFVARLRTASVKVTGRVTSTNGVGIPGIWVRFYHGNDSSGGTTDASGKYEALLYPGLWNCWPTGFGEKGFFGLPSQNFLFAAGEHTRDFQTSPLTVPVSGIVIDQFGAPLKSVYLVATFSGQNTMRAVSSEVDGSYSFTLGPGSWHIGPDWNGDLAERGYVEWSRTVVIGSTPLTTNLLFPRYTSQVAGRVRTAAGTGVSNLWVFARGSLNGETFARDTLTDSNGFFSLKTLDGSWEVGVFDYPLWNSGFRSIPTQTITLLSQTNTCLEFLATPFSSVIRGAVRDDTGAVVPGISILVEPRYGTPDQLRLRLRTTTDVLGRFEFSAPTNTWSFYLDSDPLLALDYVWLSEDPIAVTKDDQIAQRDITLLRATSRIRITIRDSSNAGAILTNSSFTTSLGFRRGEQSADLYGTLTNGVGEFSVLPGYWTIAVYPPSNYRRIDARLVKVGPEPVELEVATTMLNYDIVLNAQAVDEAGAPVPNLSFFAWGALGSSQNSDASGRFSFFLREGPTSLSLFSPDYLIPRTEINLPPGTVTNSLVHVFKKTSTLVVNLRSETGFTPNYSSLSARTRNPNGAFTTYTSSTGAVLQLPLFPGDWILSVSAGGARRIPDRSVKVGSPQTEIDIHIEPDIRTAKARGRVVDFAGAPLGSTRVRATAGFDTIETRSDADGKFELILPQGKWSTQAGSSFGAIAPFRDLSIVIGQDQELGDLVFPQSSATVDIRMTDASGANVELKTFYRIRAIQLNGSTGLESSDSGYGATRQLLLKPGQWEVTVSPIPGFASLRPFVITVPEGPSAHAIKLAPFPANAAPSIWSQFLSQYSTLRLGWDSTASMDVQFSTDLKEWNFFSTDYPSYGFVELPLIETNSALPLFFRIVTR